MTTENSVPQKQCSVCLRSFPLSKYHWQPRNDSPDGFRAQCRECQSIIKGYKKYKSTLSLQGRECISTAKTCTRCHETKPITEEYWTFAKGKRDGWSSWCRECNYGAIKAWHRIHDPNSIAKRSWLDRTRDYRAQYAREKYLENRQKKIDAAVLWNRMNKARRTEINKNYAKNNPDKIRFEWIKRRKRQYNAEGYFTEDEVRDLFRKQDGKCFHCGTDISSKFHRDHWIPLAKGGSNWISNIRLLCPHCNHTKSAKLPWIWHPERYSKDEYISA